jgi:alginate O-acetyltransferase complex protein AlgI
LQGFGYGAGRFILGLGKKMIIANTVAYPADRIFEIPHARLTFGLAWLGVVCYAMQIYFDFSGYSDMAVGLGRMFGFRFMENFNYPYASRSVTEFWRRWHISLSTWFRDYLYIPLGGNRVSQARTYLNLVIVFFLCGLWHGANWTFVAWGLFHGAFLVVERIGLRSRLDRLPAVLSRGYLLLVVLVSWVIFRSETLGDSVRYLAALFGLGARPADALGLGHFLTRELCLTLLIGAVGCAPVLPAMRGRLAVAIRGCDASARRLVCGLRYAGEAVFLAAVLLYSAMLMAADTYNPFIYFRF